MDSIGQRIKLLRQQKRLHQSEIAEMLGKKGKQVISNWENDKAEPSLADIRRLAEIFETTVAYLAGGGQPEADIVLPKGYVLMPATEVIEMQRELLELKRGRSSESR